MKKRVIFTESQLKKILGEDFTSYLDKSDNGCDFPADSNVATGTEVTGNVPGEPTPTLDTYAKEKTMTNPYMRRGTYRAVYESVKKKLNERNQALDNTKFRLGKQTNNMVNKLSSNNPNDKMINNMANEKDTSLASMYTRRRRINQMKNDNPQRYQQINGKQLEKSLTDKIENAKTVGSSLNTVKNNIPTNTKNELPKQGHHKNGNTTIYYQNN